MVNFWKQQRLVLGEILGRHISQREIADTLGFTQKLIGLWENDVSPPPIARAQDIAEVYCISFHQAVIEIANQAARIGANGPKASKKPKTQPLRRVRNFGKNPKEQGPGCRGSGIIGLNCRRTASRRFQ